MGWLAQHRGGRTQSTRAADISGSSRVAVIMCSTRGCGTCGERTTAANFGGDRAYQSGGMYVCQLLAMKQDAWIKTGTRLSWRQKFRGCPGDQQRTALTARHLTSANCWACHQVNERERLVNVNARGFRNWETLLPRWARELTGWRGGVADHSVHPKVPRQVLQKKASSKNPVDVC